MTDLFWLLQRLNWLALIDILLVSMVFLLVLLLVKATQAVPLVRGLLVLIVITLFLTSVAQLPTFSVIAAAVLPALLISIPVIFQPELRRALGQLGRMSDVITSQRRSDVEHTAQVVSEAALMLAARNWGALIIIERETGLQDLVETGVTLDSELSSALLLTIFHPNTELHDGGVIVRNGRAIAAGCVLPLTSQHVDDYRIGLRHRAGIGVTEETDAIAVVVSEEKGVISIAHEGRLIYAIDPDQLESALLDLCRGGAPLRRAAAWLPGLLRRR